VLPSASKLPRLPSIAACAHRAPRSLPPTDISSPQQHQPTPATAASSWRPSSRPASARPCRCCCGARIGLVRKVACDCDDAIDMAYFNAFGGCCAQGRTPLYDCVMSSEYDLENTIKHLLKKGADINGNSTVPAWPLPLAPPLATIPLLAPAPAPCASCPSCLTSRFHITHPCCLKATYLTFADCRLPPPLRICPALIIPLGP
jgi:predicted small lipoprotein YifL